METTNVICTVCPVGCEIEVKHENGEIRSIKNNKCERGAKHATAEVLAPERVLTSTVRINGGKTARLPVKSELPVPKNKIFMCMKQIKAAAVVPPVKAGDIIIKNVADTGIDIVATRNS